MREYKVEKIEEQVAVSVTCDVCKKKFNMAEDYMEIQEFVFIDLIGGYTSVFGDGAKIKLDMCQNCFKEHLGKYLVIDDSDCF